MHNQSEDAREGTGTRHITVEVGLWVLVGVVALALRVYHLDAALLSGGEAREAAFAWQAVSGRPLNFGNFGLDLDPSQVYSPLLFAVNVGLMTVFGAGDGIVRLWPALCGVGLALTPFLLRRWIGRLGALAAGAYLAFSPTALFASRQVDGAITAAWGGMVALAGMVRFLDEALSADGSAGSVEEGHHSTKQAWLVVSALGLGLAVTSSGVAYGMLVPLGLVGLFILTLTLTLTLTRTRTRTRAGLGQRAWEALKPHALGFLGVTLLAALALATGLGWHRGGVGAAGDLLASWLARFRAAAVGTGTGVPPPSPLAMLIIYEPLALAFGVGGLAWSLQRGWRRGRHLGILLGGGGIAGLFLLFLMPGRSSLDVLGVLVPLVMVAGLGMERFVGDLRRHGDWLGEGLHVPVVILLWVHLYLILTRYASSGNSADLMLGLAVVLLQLVLVSVFSIATSFSTALRAVVVGTGIVLMIGTVSAGWSGAFVRPSDPRELLVQDPSADGVRDLIQTLQDISWQEYGLPHTVAIRIQYESKDADEDADTEPLLAWYLRDFEPVAEVDMDMGRGKADGELLVTVTDLPSEAQIPMPEDRGEMVGQDFALRRRWDRGALTCTPGWPPQCRALVRWAFFRETFAPTEVSHWIVLWRTSHSH